MKKRKLNISSELASSVEKHYLDKSGKQLIYKPVEKIPIIQVESFPELGKLAALRFIEWVQQNPNGVISLPTGKTPEHFIKWVTYYLRNWGKEDVTSAFKEIGIALSNQPKIENLRFVQIDEFYPIDSTQHNSFYYYVQKYYVKNFGLAYSKGLFMNINEIGTADNLPISQIFPDKVVDLTLRTRYASNRLERLQKETIEIVDEFSTNYERKIREMGGIGFFLGGIGPDGHIGFNVQGSDHFSTTRLIATNYETQAAAASDLGGIEIARKSLVITIGLDTITYNPEAAAIIIAAGEAKSTIVRDSIQMEVSNKYPASVLQKLPNARFYLTHGATLRLLERRFDDVSKEANLSAQSIERALINLAIDKKKSLVELTEKDYKSDKFGELILRKTGVSHTEINQKLHDAINERFNIGMKQYANENILHTAPHHDDIMLGYLPHINHLVRDASNKHHFTYLTSGFTAVTNQYMLDLLEALKGLIDLGAFDKRFESNYFEPDFIEGKNRDVNLYLDGVATHSRTLKNEGISRRLVRNLIEIYSESNVNYLRDRINELLNYFKTQYPGKKDIPHIQRLKGMMREWEVEVLWAYYGFSTEDISHMRLGFYQGEIFTEVPDLERDVVPVYKLMKKIKPTIVSVALDPEGSGPDTHYKVLQVIAEALKMWGNDEDISNVKVWGYRNVWYRFHPAEANIYIPVSLGSMAITENTFFNSFNSQKTASFPSWEYDGLFSRLINKILCEQYDTIRMCMGKTFFLNHKTARGRAAHGVLYLKELSLDQFYKLSSELKKITVNL